ncbi:hypothetical protein LTR65_010184 [Meristemomyces frigidus]
MDAVSPLDFLDADPRPACVVDLRKCGRNGEPHIELRNTALQTQGNLLDTLLGNDEENSSARARFRAWIADEGGGAAVFTSLDCVGGYRANTDFVESPGQAGNSKYQMASAQGCQAAGMALPADINIATGRTRFASICRAAQALLQPLELDGEDLLSFKCGDAAHGFNSLTSAQIQAVLCPILVRGAKVATGFLVVGIKSGVARSQLSRAWLKCITSLASERVQAIMNAEEAMIATGEYESKSKVLENALADRNDVTEKLASTLAMIEMVDVGIFDFDTSGVLLHANEAYYRLSGHPKGDAAKGYSWADCVFPEDQEMTFTQWGLLSQGVATNFEMRWKRPMASTFDGKEDTEGQWVLAACVPTKNEAGEVIAIAGCIMDLAAQKRSQNDALKRAEALERAQASEERFTRFAESAPIGIYILGLDLKLQYVNRAWFDINGHEVVEDFGIIDWHSVVSAEGIAVVAVQLDLVIQKQQAVTFQFQLQRAWSNGQGGQGQAWALASAYPEVDKDGAVIGIAGTLTDISQLKWAESVQKQRVEEAVEARRQQDNFIDMTSHEIRNPLGAVIHCADLVMSSLKDMADLVGGSLSAFSPDQRTHFNELRDGALEAVNTIISCSSHQKRIVDDILTLSKLDSRLLTIVPSPIRLDSILRDAANMFEVDAKKVSVELRVDKADSLRTLAVDWVMLDSGRVMQVLINLITNALKFTQKEAVRVVTLSMGASRSRLSERELEVEFVPLHTLRDRAVNGVEWGSGEEVYLYFKVSDTGCGFSDEQKAIIFERFAQASPRTHSRYGGSGLGLFITRELIELQGGEIGVSSRPGDGTAFAFYVTARSVVAPQTDLAIAGPRRSSKETGSKQAKVSHTILVVEDNVVNQKVLRKQLEKLGHDVHVVSHGGEALSFLETTSCWKGNTATDVNLDVILMDIEMPVMDGFTCTRKIREAEAQGQIEGHLPIIAVSANARHEQIKYALECGMDDTISKPFRIVDLIPKIARLIAG